MEFLRFIFSSFWVWLGFTILVYLLVYLVGSGVVELVKACKPEKRRLETFRSRDILRVDIIGASDEEVKAAREEIVTAEWDGSRYIPRNDGEAKGEEAEGAQENG